MKQVRELTKERQEVQEKALKVLEEYPLCDHCLGRLFGWLSTATTNKERGHSIKLVLSMNADSLLKCGKRDLGYSIIQTLASNGMFEPAKARANAESIDFEVREECHLCSFDGECVFDKIPGAVEMAVKKTEEIEFENFLVGSVQNPELEERQDELCAAHGLLHAETLKSDFNRELGKQLQPMLGKPVEFGKPDIVIVYDVPHGDVRIQISPLFVYGRYRKLVRGIPQSRWDCGKCDGKGCEVCNHTGRKYPDSIAEYIGNPTQFMFQGSRFKFHAAGREDIDVLMLGSGRPFVVEVSEPRIREGNLEQLAQRINDSTDGKIEVDALESTARDHAQWLKENAAENVKEYTAIIDVDGQLDESILGRAQNSLSGIVIEQRTPNRVSHRRSDIIRRKHVYEVRLRLVEPCLIEGSFKVQGGTYVKELISGDEGRTIPSVAETLGLPCFCRELTVTAIHSSTPDHNP
ncbi:MAG: tRNA pseudouridine(54/55) synthase Pus10 [Candidatus Thorarchaeota archaeon]|nr:MAG: tRNA pseudouridine(54/55) synthase Pus10 [Candidatus Thorarchaeota archaeon]